MIGQNHLQILQYNIRHKALLTMAPLLHDKEIEQFDILGIQKPWFNPHNQSSFNPGSSNFHLVYRPKADTRTCFYVNKRLDLESWEVVIDGKDLCSLKLVIKDVRPLDQRREIWIHNAYNPSPTSYTSVDSLSTLPQIQNALQKADKHILLGDFNLHHPQWNNSGRFTYHSMADRLISLTQKANLNLTLSKNSVT